MNKIVKLTVLKQAKSLEKRRHGPKVSREEIGNLLERLGNDESIPGDELPERSSPAKP